MSYKYFGRLVGKVSTGKQSLIETAPADTTTPFDPQQPATKFMAYGEDATSLAFNRALAALSSNIDSLSSVLNSVTVRSAVIDPYQTYTDSHAGDPGFTGESEWEKGSLALTDDVSALGGTPNLHTGITNLSLATPSGIAPANWVYVGLNETDLSKNVSFHRVEGQYGSGSTKPEGHTNLLSVPNPDQVEGLQAIYDTFHTVVPSDVYENSTEYNAGGGYSYHQPKYKSQQQAYLTDNASTGIPLYVPPVKRIKTDLAPYNGNERYARISGWDSDGLYMKDYAADDLYLKAGCYVEVVGDGSESAQIGNNGLFQIAEIIPADETAPTASGSKLILTRGGFHRVTVRDYTQFMEGELVSWRTNPYHQDSGDPTDPDSSALKPSLRTNFAHVAFVIPRPDLNSDSKPDERPGDLYLRAASEASRFTTKDSSGTQGAYDWTRGVPKTVVGDARYGGQRSYGHVGMPDKEEGADQNWNLLPGTFIFHGHAHMYPYDYGVGDWGMGGGAIPDVKFGSDVLSASDGVSDSVISAGEPVVFDLEEYAGIVYPCAPPGFILNPLFSFDPRSTFYSGAYQAHVKVLTTVRESLVSEISPISANRGVNLENGFNYAEAQALKGWQYFLRSGIDSHKDAETGTSKDWDTYSPDYPIRHVVGDGLNGPSSPTAQILGSDLWEVAVTTASGGLPAVNLTEAFQNNGWGINGDYVAFIHPDSSDTYPDGTAKPQRQFWGKIISATASEDEKSGTVIIGGLRALPEDDHLSHDHLNVLGSGGWPIQSSDQNSIYSSGGHAGGSIFEDPLTGEEWEVVTIIKAPSISGTLENVVPADQSVPFIPSHGLNAAYHNHFSASSLLRGGIDASKVQLPHGATGHIIHTNPVRPFTLSLPNFDHYEQALRVRSHSANITLLRLDDSAQKMDAVYPDHGLGWEQDLLAASEQKVRIGWYSTITPLYTLQSADFGRAYGYATDGRADSGLSLRELEYNPIVGTHTPVAEAASSSIGFGSATISSHPNWFVPGDGQHNLFDPDAFSLVEARGSTLFANPDSTNTAVYPKMRRDVSLESPISAWAEDNWHNEPSFMSAVYNHRNTPTESQDRSVFGAIEATVLGNYSFDLINSATRALHGDNHIDVGEAVMATEHQFGVLSNGVITGGYCWAKVNVDASGSDETIPDHLFKAATGGAFLSFNGLPNPSQDQSILFYDAYVLVGGTKWHVPSQLIDLADKYNQADISGSEFLIFFDARARQLMAMRKPNSMLLREANVLGEPAVWAAQEEWWYGLLEEAHVVPFAKVYTNTAPTPEITKVVNLRKPISRVDERTHLLVGVCNEFEWEARHSNATEFGQMKADGYQAAQMHFRNVGEALIYIGEMSKVRAFQKRQWTIEVVGTCYEEEDLARGISFPLKFPVHGINIIGHKGSSGTFLKGAAGTMSTGGGWNDSWDRSDDPSAAKSTNYGLLSPYDVVLGNQSQSSMILWDERGPLFDLNSRQGVTVRDIHLEYRGNNHPAGYRVMEGRGPFDPGSADNQVNQFGSYYNDAWLGENNRPHIAAFICSRAEGDLSVPAIDADRGNAPFSGVYGKPNVSNAAFSGNYLFEGVTLHRGGILCDFYDAEGVVDTRTKAALDNITLRNCRAINVSHGLAAFGCSSYTNHAGFDGDWANPNLVTNTPISTKNTNSDKKYHKNILIEGCEAVCTESDFLHPSAWLYGTSKRHKVFSDITSAKSKRRAGVFATHSKEITIRDCSFHGAFAYGVYLGEDVTWDSAWAEESQHWCTGVVENCVISTPLVAGVYAASKHQTSDIRVRGNTIRETGWPYWERGTTEFVAGARAVPDHWAIFVDGTGIEVTNNQIRSVVYSKENFGVREATMNMFGGWNIGQAEQPGWPYLDFSTENLCGGIYAKPGWRTTDRPDVPMRVEGNTLNLVGRALKGIVIPDGDWNFVPVPAGWEVRINNSHSTIISGNAVQNQLTAPYNWSANQYDFRTWDSLSYDDVFESVGSFPGVVVESLPTSLNMPFALYVGHNNRAPRVINNNLAGPVCFGGGNDGTQLKNNLIYDPVTEPGELDSAYLPEAIEVFEEKFYPNASLVSIVSSSNVQIDNNVIPRGHVFIDDSTMVSVSNNSFYSLQGTVFENLSNQPLGIFTRSNCHQGKISGNLLPGNAYVIVGVSDDCHDYTISNNKWGMRNYPILVTAWELPSGETEGDRWSLGAWHDEPFSLGPRFTGFDSERVSTEDSIHNGGLFYWNGGGGLITGNTLLDNDIMVGNYMFSNQGSWYGGTQMPLEWFESESIHSKSGVGHTISNNKLNGGSIHVYSDACLVTDNDLYAYDQENGGFYPQPFYGMWQTYSPNIEVAAKRTRVSENKVAGEIWLYQSGDSDISGNMVGGNIMVHASPNIRILGNNLSCSTAKQPNIGDLNDGVVNLGNPVHGTGLGSIWVSDSDCAQIKNNTSVIGFERISSRDNLKLLGSVTDPDDHLTYADALAPFTGIMALDFYNDMLEFVQQNRSAAIAEVLAHDQFQAQVPGFESVDTNTWTAFGIAWLMNLLTMGGEANKVAAEWNLVFGERDILDALTMTMTDFTELLNVREYATDHNKRIGGTTHKTYCQQPYPGSADDTNYNKDYFWQDPSATGLDPEDSKIGPFYPLNYQNTEGYYSSGYVAPIFGKLDRYCGTYDMWGRRVLVAHSDGVEIDGNTLSHVEIDSCRDASITSNKLFWGAFNPGYVNKNHSILVYGDVGTINISNNECGGSIWVKDNFNWGFPDDEGTAYTWGSIHVNSTINYNIVGNKYETTEIGTNRRPSSNRLLRNGVEPTISSSGYSVDTSGTIRRGFTVKYMFGGGGCIVIDNCTRLTAIGNDCDSYWGALPDRWNDNLHEGGEWGEIYVNRLGNKYKGIADSSGSITHHAQNFQTVITNNKAAGVMGWVRQPDMDDAINGALQNRLAGDDQVFAPHIVIADINYEEKDAAHLLDRVIPCIGASYGQWTGNRLTSDAWTYWTSTFGQTPTGYEETLEEGTGASVFDPRYFNNANVGGARWWGNMDSWTGPAQANGVMTENAVPTCTGSKWFGNPNYYVNDEPYDSSTYFSPYSLFQVSATLVQSGGASPFLTMWGELGGP